MALQKRRRGPARTAQQRSAWMKKSGENAPMVQPCPGCGAPRISHRVCMSCGQYRGETVVAKKTAEE
ncbi:MAG: 50S ribosomal protein L32 [Deltaproteobacteria bacterium]|nr:50S ribosomal protein L32 [Deltaproteobacteria bacterium]